jgi:hypothetical protein
LKKLSLFRLLLDTVGESHYRISSELELSPCNLSKLAANLTHRPKTLQRAADYLGKRFNFKEPLDAALLTEELGPKELCTAALWARAQRQKAALNA